MSDAVLSPVAPVVEEIDPALTELHGRWAGLQGWRGEETGLYMVYHS